MFVLPIAVAFVKNIFFFFRKKKNLNGIRALQIIQTSDQFCVEHYVTNCYFEFPLVEKCLVCKEYLAF